MSDVSEPAYPNIVSDDQGGFFGSGGITKLELVGMHFAAALLSKAPMPPVNYNSSRSIMDTALKNARVFLDAAEEMLEAEEKSAT